MESAPFLLGVLFRPAEGAPAFGRQSPFFTELALAAKALGAEVFCFAPAPRFAGPVPGWSLRGQSWQYAERALPRVVYDRFLPRSPAERKSHRDYLLALAGRDVALFNPPEVQALLDDKRAFSRWSAERGFPVVPHLSLSQARPQLLTAATGGYFLKPRFGFGGSDIRYCELTPEGASLARLGGGSAPTLLGRQALVAELEASNTQQELVLSPAVKGPGIQGRAFDIRLLLQRPRAGADFRCIGVLRLSRPGQLLSNLSRGGRALPWEALTQLSGLQGMPAALERLSLDLAFELDRGFGSSAEIGLDWLIDEAGRPRLLEANAKPARWALTLIAEDPAQSHDLRRAYANRRRQSVEMPLRFGLELGKGVPASLGDRGV